MKRKVNVFVSILLLVSLSLTLMSATNASEYFSTYYASASRDSQSKITISFDATGTNFWPEFGVKTVEFQRSRDGVTWSKVTTYSYEDYPNMMDYDSASINSSVSYQGSSLYKYRAVVTFWAGENGVGEEKTRTTLTV